MAEDYGSTLEDNVLNRILYNVLNHDRGNGHSHSDGQDGFTVLHIVENFSQMRQILP